MAIELRLRIQIQRSFLSDRRSLKTFQKDEEIGSSPTGCGRINTGCSVQRVRTVNQPLLTNPFFKLRLFSPTLSPPPPPLPRRQCPEQRLSGVGGGCLELLPQPSLFGGRHAPAPDCLTCLLLHSHQNTFLKQYGLLYDPVLQTTAA